MNETTQAMLDGLTLAADIRTAAGYRLSDEAEVRRRADVHAPAEFEVVEAERIAETRTDGGKAFTGCFLTADSARAVLGPEFSPLTANGVTYAAPKSLPLTRVSGYTSDQVEAMRTAAEEIRAEREANAAAQKRATAARRKAWLAGEPGAMLSYDDMICAEDVRDGVRQTPRAVIGATTIGREYPVSAVTAAVRGDGTEVFDSGRGEWVRDE